MRLSRRSFTQLSLSGALGLGLGGPLLPPRRARADDRQFRHGLSLFGELKYPQGFPRFDYVNPDAPKGGKVRLYALGSFDSLNPYTYNGDPMPAAATNETLLTGALDEPSSEYGLIAESVWHPEDHGSVVYRLRPEARFHDGHPITPEDVIWSMEALKGAHPFYAAYYKNVAKAEQTGEHEVTFTFAMAGNRELPQITGQLPVLPKHWWTAIDASGKPRDITKSSLEIPLGSGAYQCVEVKPGELVRLKRKEDYWGKDLPVNAGQNNFDEISYEYFKDQSVALEAFKADRYDYRVESTAKDWATGYDFPAVQRGDVVLEKIPSKQGTGMQCFAFNTRRAQFKDARVRLAFNYAFDFEWANQNLFFSQYTRTDSFFANSDLGATGLPDERELALLTPLKDQIPAEVFTTAYANPVNDSQQAKRSNLRMAAKLLQDAGYKQTQQNGQTVLADAAGTPLSVEFLLDSPAFERVVLPYTQDLAKLGITSRVRTIDPAQYEQRTKTFDYDIVVNTFPQSLSPGNEQRDFWGSEAAERQASRNLIGIANPAVDKLVDAIIFATSREELVAACRALDRVLLWSHYVVPMWYIGYSRTARWDRFGRPEKLPDYSPGFPDIWWFDAERAKKVKA